MNVNNTKIPEKAKIADMGIIPALSTTMRPPIVPMFEFHLGYPFDGGAEKCLLKPV